ncbi:MAG: 4a-hydroxytetrahydrobiopterin dehydratase [Thermoplasmata archaeon]
MVKLTEKEIEERLAQLEGWTRDGDSIARPYRFPSFMKAIEFINRVAELAEQADHHPDLFNSWRTVKLALITHDEGGLTERDFRLAARINEIDIE